MNSQTKDESRVARIRERAYELWEEEGRPEGREDIHWKRASEEYDDATKLETHHDRPTETPPKRRTKKAP